MGKYQIQVGWLCANINVLCKILHQTWVFLFVSDYKVAFP